MAFHCTAFGWTEYFQDEPGVSHLQLDRPTSSGQRPAVQCRQVSLINHQSGSGQQWTRPSGPQRCVVHTFTGGPRGKRNSEAPHINYSSSPLRVFLLYFAEIIALLVVETNWYYHDHLDRLDEGPSPLPDVTEAEMLVFLALTLQMGHCVQDKLKDYWSRAEHFHTTFYGNAMKRDRFFHILCFLHFTDKDQNLQTKWWEWIHVWYDSLFGQRQTAHCATPDCNSRNSVRIDKENTRMWPQTVHGQLLLIPRLIRWLGHEANLLLWHCPTQQEGHATGLKPQENDNQTGWPSGRD